MHARRSATSPQQQRKSRLVLLSWLVVAAGLYCGVSPATGEPAPTATPTYTASERKAGAIYQFCKLVTWPAEVQAMNPLVITVIGKSELNDAIKELDQAQIGDRVIHVEEVSDPEQTEISPGVLVIGGDQEQKVPTILDSIKGHPILTVGDADKFTSEGGGIAFYQDNGALRFHVNTDAFDQAGLSPDRHLLDLADHPTAASAGAAPPILTPSERKAGAIYQFCKEVTWPSEVQSADTLTITVIGKSELTDAVKKLDHAKVGSRVIHVQEITDPEQSDIPGGVLVIGEDQEQKIPSILDSIKGHPILTIGDAGKFASQGGGIELYQDNGKLRCHVNPDAFEQAGLSLDPVLDMGLNPDNTTASATPTPTVQTAKADTNHGSMPCCRP